MLILDKPAGMVTTNENRKGMTKTVEDWVSNYYPNKLARSGIVHRLDKGTSGILTVAKDEKSLVNLKKQFKNRLVVKRYMALVAGDLPQKGNVLMPIGRSPYSLGKFKVMADGKRAETEFRVMKRYKIEGKVYSLVEIDLKTGRTHQIRVHFSYLGWPLAGDVTYGGPKIAGLQRPFLQSKYLQLHHPKTQKVMEFSTKLAIELQAITDEAVEC